MIKLKSLLNENISPLDIASDFKRKLDVDEFDVKAQCLAIANELASVLRSKGIQNIKLVKGTFAIDFPDSQNYSEWDSEDFDSDDEMETAKYLPLHYWLEVNGNILDITASQFNDELEDENMPDVVFGTYQNNPRYTPENRRNV